MMQKGYHSEKDVATALHNVLTGIKSRYQLQIDTLESLLHVFIQKPAIQEEASPAEPAPFCIIYAQPDSSVSKACAFALSS